MTRTASRPRPRLRTRSGGGGPPVDLATLAREGWVAIPGVLAPDAAADLAAACEAVLEDGAPGGASGGRGRGRDRRVGGTRHAGGLLGRVPGVEAVLADGRVRAAVAHLLGLDAPGGTAAASGAGGVAAADGADRADELVAEPSFRCPQPGFGEQVLHADAPVPARGGPTGAGAGPGPAAPTATAIVALCPFTPGNGATAVVPGSHRRPDLQRLARTLDPARHERVLTGPAGTVFLFDSRLVHRGTRNRSARPGPSLQVLWRPAPVRAPGQAPRPAGGGR